MTAGNPPKPPPRAGTIPGVAPAGKPAAAPAPKPAGPAVKPAESLSREEIRGIAQAISRAELGSLKDDLAARLQRIEDRLAALEHRPVAAAPAATPPPLPVAAPTPVFAPAPAQL